MITEIVFGRRVAKMSRFDSFTVPESDTKYENTVYKKALLVGAFVYLAIILFVIVARANI